MDLVDNAGIARIKPWYGQWQDHGFVEFVLVYVGFVLMQGEMSWAQHHRVRTLFVGH